MCVRPVLYPIESVVLSSSNWCSTPLRSATVTTEIRPPKLANITGGYLAWGNTSARVAIHGTRNVDQLAAAAQHQANRNASFTIRRIKLTLELEREDILKVHTIDVRIGSHGQRISRTARDETVTVVILMLQPS